MKRSSAQHFAATVAALILALMLSCKKNHPPDTPELLDMPSACAKDTTYTFRVTAVDPDEDSISLRVYWGDTVSQWSDWVPSGDTVSMAHSWSSVGTFGLQAQARDFRGLASGWSDTHQLQVIVTRPPLQPATPIGPNKGGQDSTYSFASYSSDPDGDRVSIRFYWGDRDTSDWSGLVADGETVSMDHAWTAADTYMVWAQARDTGGGLSPWSGYHRMTVRPPDTLRKWRFQVYADTETGYALYLSPAIGADGTIYVGSPDSCLYAINPDGTLRWRYVTGYVVSYASPAIGADGTIYIGSSGHYLYAVNPDGTLKWGYATDGSIHSTPAIAADGTIYASSPHDYFHAVNPDGTLKWRCKLGASSRSSPAVAADGAIYVGDEDEYVDALNPDSTLKWRHLTARDVSSSPAIAADGTVIIGSEDHSLYAFNPDSTLRWLYQTGGDIEYSSPAIGPDGTIYVGSDDDRLHAVNPDGTPRWTYLTGANVRSSPALMADGGICFGSADSHLFVLNQDGTLRWLYETGGDVLSSPAIGADGTIYSVSNDGYLYALKGTSPLADSPWPKFHHDSRNTGRVGGGR